MESEKAVVTGELSGITLRAFSDDFQCLFAAINAARRWRFMHDDLAKTGALRLQFVPEPFCHFFNRWILQPLLIVPMVSLCVAC